MITDFKSFGTVHIISLLVPVLIAAVWIILHKRSTTEKQRAALRISMAALIVMTRGARYMMDVSLGVFEWTDLLSLHICHIDLILLVICLIRPNKVMFNFCFVIGIPMALAVALLPGSNHPAPGLPRAILFIMSHTMLVTGIIYLAVTERMKPKLKAFAILAVIGNLCLIPLYFVNRALDANYLYIMEAPEGTVIASLDKVFGWPGYVFALDALALILMLLMVFLGHLLWKATERTKKEKPVLETV